MYNTKVVQLLILLFSISNVGAQISKESKLFKTLKTKDSLLFDVGFNRCNLKIIEDLITNDIEFFHDKNGITKSKKEFINSLNKNLCNSGKNKIKRILETTSLQVFPLYNDNDLYGVMQKGKHNFGQTNASFSHIWLLKNNKWKLSRVISYNHHQEKQKEINNFLNLSVNELKKYLGIYEFSSEFVLTVRIKEGKLYGGSQGEEVLINCYQEHKFIDYNQVYYLEFILDKDGKVTSLYMKGSGMEMTASKRK